MPSSGRLYGNIGPYGKSRALAFWTPTVDLHNNTFCLHFVVCFEPPLACRYNS